MAAPAPPSTCGPVARRGAGRSRLVAALAVVVAASLLSACMTNNQAKTLGQLNNDRARYGLWALGDFGQSVDKAQAWANHLAAVGYLEHTNLPSNYSVGWCALGENVGYGPSTVAIEAAFMNSTEHRDNILSRTWNYAGTGVATASNGTVFVVQEFIKTC